MFCGAVLREWRKKENYSQVDMAKLLNLSTCHYSCIEQGKRQPSTKLITKMLNITNISADSLFSTEINKVNMSQDFLKSQMNILEAQKKILNLQSTLFAKYVEIARNNTIIHILRDVMSVANSAIQKKYSLDRYKREIIEIAKNAAQKVDISSEIICEAMGISIHTLKKWIGKEVVLFMCDFNLFEPVYVSTPELAGEAFRCIDCVYLQNKNCKGFGVGINYSDSEVDIFSIINDLTRKGVTDKKQQLEILKERYNFQTTEATLSEYIRRNKKGEHVPDSFKFMIHGNVDV